MMTPPREHYYYLACPHWDDDPAVRQLRYEAAVAAQVNLTHAGFSIFNPIAMSHDADKLARGNNHEITHDQWLRADYPLLFNCSGLIVLQLPGWKISRGVAWEIAGADELNRPIIMLPGDEYVKDWPEPPLYQGAGITKKIDASWADNQAMDGMPTPVKKP